MSSHQCEQEHDLRSAKDSPLDTSEEESTSQGEDEEACDPDDMVSDEEDEIDGDEDVIMTDGDTEISDIHSRWAADLCAREPDLVCDPEGDLQIILKVQDMNDFIIKVSSKHLTLASSVSKTILDIDGVAGQQTRTSKRS